MSENPGLRTNLRGHVIAVSTCLLLAAFAAFGQIEAPVRPPAATTQTQQKTGFRAVSYEVFASLAPETQMLTARAIVEFEAQSPSRAVECELHPNLSLSDVRDAAGKVLEIDRGGQNGLDVVVTLPDVVRAGQRTKLTFSYSGVLANEENSAISGVRLASIGKDGAYLLLPARWFPLTGYPSNRFTGVFHIEVPQNFVVVGTGTSETPVPTSSAPTPAPVLGNRNPQGGGRSPDSGAPRLSRRTQDGVRPDSTPPTVPLSNAPTSTATTTASNSSSTSHVHFPRRSGRGGRNFCGRRPATFPNTSRRPEHFGLLAAERRQFCARIRRRGRADCEHSLRSVWTAAEPQSHDRADSRRYAANLCSARPAPRKPTPMDSGSQLAATGKSGGSPMVGKSSDGCISL